MSKDYAAAHISQRKRLEALLLDGAWHSWRELRTVAGVRYGARLLELRRLGHKIDSVVEGVGDGKRYRMDGAATPQIKRVKVLLNEEDALSILGGPISTGALRSVRDALESFDLNRAKL